MKNISVVGILIVLVARNVWAQPPMPAKPPKPPVPTITLAELEKSAGGPTLITLHFKEVPIADILNELSKQCGIRVRANFWSDEQRSKKYSLDIEKQPFWDAMQQISETLKLFPQQWGGQNGMTLSPDSDGSPKGSKQLNTPLLSMVAKTLTRTHTINYSGKPNTTDAPETPSMTLQTAILIDPKLSLLNNATKAKVTEIVDEKGKSLKGDQDEIWIYGETPALWQMQIPLKFSTTMGKKMARLSGSLRAFVVAKSEPWEIDDILKTKGATKTVKIGGKEETYTIEDATKQGEGLQIRISIKRGLEIAPSPVDGTADGQQLKWARRDWSRWMRLTDDKGVQFQGYNSGSSEDEMTFTFNANQQFPDDAKPGEPAKLLINIPLEFRLLEIPFEFKDLLLP